MTYFEVSLERIVCQIQMGANHFGEIRDNSY